MLRRTSTVSRGFGSRMTPGVSLFMPSKKNHSFISLPFSPKSKNQGEICEKQLPHQWIIPIMRFSWRCVLTDIFDEPCRNKIRTTFKATDSFKALLFLKATTSNKLQKIFETVYFIQGGKLVWLDAVFGSLCCCRTQMPQTRLQVWGIQACQKVRRCSEHILIPY